MREARMLGLSTTKFCRFRGLMTPSGGIMSHPDRRRRPRLSRKGLLPRARGRSPHAPPLSYMHGNPPVSARGEGEQSREISSRRRAGASSTLLVTTRVWVLRLGALLLLSACGEGAAGCGPRLPATNWTCDFDASESRPLSDPDAAASRGDELPSAVCQSTCGPPATACTLTILDGGLRAALCPVCSF